MMEAVKAGVMGRNYGWGLVCSVKINVKYIPREIEHAVNFSALKNCINNNNAGISVFNGGVMVS